MLRTCLVIALFGAACGDNRTVVVVDARDQLDGATDPDAPPASTLTAFVIDLIENHTDDTTNPVPYGAFAILPDPDATDDDDSAYAQLFP